MARLKVRQEVEEYKIPKLEKNETLDGKFEEYCKLAGLTTPMQKAASAQNPIYIPYLLDYVGYDDTTDPAKPKEVQRSTYVRAVGRIIMAERVKNALSEHLRVPTRLVIPKTEWMGAKEPNTAIAQCSMRIEAQIGSEWVTYYTGDGTSRRKPANDYDKFFIEKAETAARARAIAAAGIGIDISGGISTIEEMMEQQKMEATAVEGDEKRVVDVLEVRIRGCSDIPALNKLSQDLSKDKTLEKLNSNQMAHLSDVFEQVRAELNEKSKATTSEK